MILNGKYGINNLDFSIFNKKKILVTGHTGFKGSWLTIWLLQAGAEITGYSLEPKTRKDNYCVTELSGKIKEYIYDIRDKEKIFKVISYEKPEIIFHLAAQPLVLESYSQPLYTIETNIGGTANLLEAFRKSESARLLVVITTDKVYENFESQIGYKETDRLGGKDLYSASKASAEIIANSYQESFFLNNPDKTVVTCRAGNVIGGGDWSENRIVPDFIKAIENQEELIIRNPNSTRPWQFVLEPLGGYMLLVKRILTDEKKLAGAWNFGPLKNSNIQVEELVKLIIQYFGRGNYRINNDLSSKKETNYLSLDISKAANQLNWKPCLSIDRAVQFTVDWYKSYKNENMFECCNNQISNYIREWKLKNSN